MAAARTTSSEARPTHWTALIGALALLLPARAGADVSDAPLRLDGLAAVVGGSGPGAGNDVVLQSDVELRARISLSGRTEGPLELGPVPTSALGASLNEIVGELLIAREARRVQAATPSAAAIERERKRLASTAGGAERLAALLEALSANAEEIDAIARRRALVGDFLSANLTGVTVVTDSEVERAYAAQQQAFAGVERTEALRQLRAKLSREALDHTVERWVTVLRSRTQVRTYVQY